MQRYLLPSFIISLYFSVRFRCLVSPQARVQISSTVSFGRGTVIKAFVILQTHQGHISFGENCAVSSFSHISTGNGDVLIGDNVRIGPNVTIVASRRHFDARERRIVDQGHSSEGILIGDDVLIGAGVIILDGCTIGTGAVIGAGSVVTEDIPPYAIVAGSPARILRFRE